MKKIFAYMILIILFLMPLSIVNANVEPTNPTYPPENTPTSVNVSWQNPSIPDSPYNEAVKECINNIGETFDYGIKFGSFTSGTSGTDSGNTITISNVVSVSGFGNNEKLLFDWSANNDALGVVIVKSDTYANIWEYDSVKISDIGLHGFDYTNNLYKGISHITFCWNEGGKESGEASVENLGCDDANSVLYEAFEISSTGLIVRVYDNEAMTDPPVITHDPSTSPDKTKTTIYPEEPAGTYYLDYEALSGYSVPLGLDTQLIIGVCDDDKESEDATVTPLGCENISSGLYEAFEISSTGLIVRVYYDQNLSDLALTHDPTNSSNDTKTTIYSGYPAGTYYLDYDPLPGYDEPEGLDTYFEIGVCDSEKVSAKASIQLGACSYTIGDGSLTPVTISLTNANLTLDGKLYEPKLSTTADEYKGSFTITMPPGSYSYKWESIDPDIYDGAGQSILKVDSCAPEEEEKEEVKPVVDPQPDVPSAGSAPSLIATGAPLLQITMGLSLAWIMIKRRLINR